MKGITNFCKITYHDYVVEALPNGGLRATIECYYPPHVMKIKEMAEDRGYTVDTTDCGEIVIYSDEGWEDMAEKYGELKTPTEKMIIKNKYGEPLEYDDVVEYMDDDIREYLHHQLAPCSAQYFYDEYCKMHKGVYGEEFFIEKENIVW